MFKELLREVDRINGLKVSVSVPADAEGYLDRGCPSSECLFEFKVHETDWDDKVRDEQVFCPFCGHTADSDKWWTQEQITYAKEAAFTTIERGIGRALRRDAENWNRRQPSDSFIRITMRVDNHPERILLPPQAADPMRLKITCPSCACRYAVIGAAFFC